MNKGENALVLFISQTKTKKDPKIKTKMNLERKNAGFLAKAILLMLLVSNFFVGSASASERHEITPQTMLELTNASRREVGAVELKSNSQLAAAAEAKASDMLSFQYFDHNSPSGVTPWFWIKSSGYEYSYAGENLAIDFISAEGAHQAFMNSSSHRENILNTNYQEIGIAVKKGIFEGEESIIVVEEFGARSAVQVSAALNSKNRSERSVEIKKVSADKRENKDLNSIPVAETGSSERTVIEGEAETNKDASGAKEDKEIVASKAEELEMGNNLFVDSLYYPNKVFEKEKICLGIEEWVLNSISVEEIVEQESSADRYLAKKYDDPISSSDSFKNGMLLFALSITMTMNLVYISSANIEENDV